MIVFSNDKIERNELMPFFYNELKDIDNDEKLECAAS